MARILVIDDDPEIRELLDQVLKGAGHEVALAADGREGVALFVADPLDMVLTDIYMPNQEGLETIKELHLRFPTTPIVAMSGREAAPAMLDIARKLGAVDTLQKPFTVEELLAVISRAM